MTYNRKFFSGDALASTITAPIGSSDTTIGVTPALTGWPASFPFIGVLDKGSASEEKILILSGTTSLTVTRGADGTTAVPHLSGATLQHSLDAGTISNHEAFVAGNGTITPSTSVPGDAAVDGTSAFPAAADHHHAREAWGSGQSSSSAPGDTAADGVQVTLARSDHKHARESIATLVSDVTSGLEAVFDPRYLGQSLELTGATAATRYAGGTASGAPASGSFTTGDHVVDQQGGIWVCTNGGSPGTWVNVGFLGNPAGRLWNNTQVLVPVTTETQVTSMTTDFTKGGVTVSSNALVVPVTGIYRISAKVIYENNGGSVSQTGTYLAQIYKNGVEICRFAQDVTGAIGIQCGPNGTESFSLSSSDSISLFAWQDSGAQQGTQTGSLYTSLSLALESR